MAEKETPTKASAPLGRPTARVRHTDGGSTAASSTARDGKAQRVMRRRPARSAQGRTGRCGAPGATRRRPVSSAQERGGRGGAPRATRRRPVGGSQGRAGRHTEQHDGASAAGKEGEGRTTSSTTAPRQRAARKRDARRAARPCSVSRTRDRASEAKGAPSEAAEPLGWPAAQDNNTEKDGTAQSAFGIDAAAH